MILLVRMGVPTWVLFLTLLALNWEGGNLCLWVAMEGVSIPLMALFLRDRFSSQTWEQIVKFFVIQGFASLLWVGRVQASVIFPRAHLWALGALWTKMGLYPFHGWMWGFVLSPRIGILWAILTIQKVVPLLILWQTHIALGGLARGIFPLIVLNLLFIAASLPIYQDLVPFLFLSGIFHLRSSLLLALSNRIVEARIYLLLYMAFSRIFFLHLLTMSGGRKKSLLSAGYQHLWALHLFNLRGFPPSPLFWLKVYFISGTWECLSISFWALFLVVNFLYLFALFLFLAGSPGQPRAILQLAPRPGGLGRLGRTTGRTWAIVWTLLLVCFLGIS